jgi:carboxylesterase 2/para-nitrobenzyl esterase
MPAARGLFRRAIVQSGGAQHLSSPAVARRIGLLFAQKLGVDATREAIAASSIQETLSAQNEVRAEILARPDPSLWGEIVFTLLPWQPTIDGSVLPDDPISLLSSGSAGNVDVLIGTNTEETRLMLLPALAATTGETLAAAAAGFGLRADEAIAAYREMYPDASPGDLFAALNTDWGWRIPALRFADAHAGGPGSSRTFMYEFAWRSPAFGGLLGAAHAVEIPFVFDTLRQGTQHILGAEPPQALADTMHRAWVDFATTGDPGWPEYQLDRRRTMHFDVVPKVVDDPMARARALWQDVR